MKTTLGDLGIRNKLTPEQTNSLKGSHVFVVDRQFWKEFNKRRKLRNKY